VLIYIFPSNAKKFIKSHMRATCFVVPLKISSIVFRPKVDMRRSVLRFVITTWVLDCELQCLNMVEDWNALFDLIFCSCMRTVCHSKPNGPHQNKNAHVHESILLFMYIYMISHIRSSRWRSWLRHSATSRKVGVSIPDGIIGIFHWRNSSVPGVNSALNKNEYQEYFLGVKAAGAWV